MSDSALTPEQEKRRRLRKSRMTTIFFALIILIPSSMGFGKKFMELVALTKGEVDGVFAISPVMNYLLASVGFFFLFCWAIANGMFGDIEQPKKAFLETERMLDDEERF
jgi:nitrogen fixation-related uncharacterized protein